MKAGGLLLGVLLLCGDNAGAQSLNCGGEAPAWRLDIEGRAATFRQSVDGLGEAVWVLHGVVVGTLQAGLMWRGRSAGTNADLVVFIAAGEGASHAVTLAMPDGGARQGQCSAAGPVAAVPRETPWWERAVEFVPAMNACLARAGGTDPRVTKVWRRDDGRVSMRVRTAYGGWWDCVLDAAGQEVGEFTPLPADSLDLPGEGLVVFTSIRNRQPPTGACYQNHQPVVDTHGQRLGWLSDLVC